MYRKSFLLKLRYSPAGCIVIDSGAKVDNVVHCTNERKSFIYIFVNIFYAYPLHFYSAIFGDSLELVQRCNGTTFST